MSRDEALRRLRANEARIRAKGTSALYLFGSTARDEASMTSDVDLLVEFTDIDLIDLFDIGDLQQDLSDMLRADVDIAVSHARNTEFVARLRRDLVQVF